MTLGHEIRGHGPQRVMVLHGWFGDHHAWAPTYALLDEQAFTYAFPDYHGPADTWDKIDYANMAAIDRTVALAVWTIANDPKAPRWNADNPKAAKYVEAARRLHGEQNAAP